VRPGAHHALPRHRLRLRRRRAARLRRSGTDGTGRVHDYLAAKTDPDGLLPPWTDWWDEDISALFPSVEVREQVEREQPRLPLSYFATLMTVPPGWDTRPGAYLAFGDAYAPELADATARGWPVRTLPGEHLHMLIDPAQVATEITTLLSASFSHLA
jgi:hypothetical protein